MLSTLISSFDVGQFGFGFTNQFDKPFVLDTLLGAISFGQNGGLCGGMVFASLDFFSIGRRAPDILTDSMFDYLCERQVDSLDLPRGLLRYMSWQTGPDSSTYFLNGTSYSTIVTEWPKIRALLDNGYVAPLGLIRSSSWDPGDLTRHHQVLAYGYEQHNDSELLVLRVCDPNYPRDHGVTLKMGIGRPDSYRPVMHNKDSTEIRGFFLSPYGTPKIPPTN